jgi:hypothetical protein
LFKYGVNPIKNAIKSPFYLECVFLGPDELIFQDWIDEVLFNIFTLNFPVLFGSSSKKA